MIELQHVKKRFVLNGSVKVVARDLNIIFPTGESVGLLGRNGAGKSSLLGMISGQIAPDSGKIVSSGTISWPVGFAGSFHNEMTGAQNAKFVARIYGADTDSVVDFVRDFAALGQHFHLPLRSYSAGMRSRLAFGVSMALPFDTYLIDEVTATGDAAFTARSSMVLGERLKAASAIIVSHSMQMIRNMCTSGAVLEDGRLFYYARVEKAIEHHEYLMRGEIPPWMRG